MIPGEYFLQPDPLDANAGRETCTILVRHSGDRPIQVGSHYHFFEVNAALVFDRVKARGMRLNIAAGNGSPFRTGEQKDRTPVALGGNCFENNHCLKMAQAMFMVVKQGFCTMVEAVMEMSFTGQKALWHAPTAVHWQQACKQRKRFYANRMDFRELMEKGDLTEVDELGVLMLVCYKGVDGVNEWIVAKGGKDLLE